MAVTFSRKAEFGGVGIKLTGVYKTSVYRVPYSAATGAITASAINNAIRACKSAGYDGGIIVSAKDCGDGIDIGDACADVTVECYIKE
jgi:hypothetical protein